MPMATSSFPSIGTMRFDVLVVPPDGEEWSQTTTLEGSLGWDTWLQEAGTGLDNEFVVAAEPFPWTIFGYVAPTDTLTTTAPENGSISGVIMASSSYLPSDGGLPHMGDIWGGLMGTKLERPIAYPWIALNDLQNGDTAVWVGRGDVNGAFSIPNVPPGNYLISYWDEKHHFILDWVQLTVAPGMETDVGVRTMVGWFAEWYGHVFLDENENGRMDPGEPGIPDYTVVMRDRDNTEIDRMSIACCHRRYRFLRAGEGLSHDLLDGPRSRQRPFPYHRRHLPGQQPAGGDHNPGQRRRREHLAHPKPVGPP